MKWRSNGQEICIAYDDGHVILGTVDGSRLWSRDVGQQLALVEWAPDGQWLLFGGEDGSVMVFNHAGTKIGAIELVAVADVGTRVPLVSLEWYDGAEGYVYPGIPSLAIAFANGRVQIMREPHDPHPILVDTGLRLTNCKWNTSGTVLALGGVRAGGPGGKDVSEVQFYTPFGRYITNMKVPGGAITSLTWEGGGMRMAVRIHAPPARLRACPSPLLSSPRGACASVRCVCVRSWRWTASSSSPTCGPRTSGRPLATAACTPSRGPTGRSSASCSGTPRPTSGERTRPHARA